VNTDAASTLLKRDHSLQFTTLQLHEQLLQGIVEAGFSHCMPVQAETFVHSLEGRDVFVQSQTGTGKTAAFLVTIFQRMAHEDPAHRSKALIIAPTRELAVQIENEAILLAKYLDIRTGCFYGGVNYTKQEKLLQSGLDVFIGTPGRLIDFNQQGKINLHEINMLVIDEADRLFDMGFLPDLRRILKKLPCREERLTMLFSATLDYRVRELAWEYMNDPAEIEIEPEHVTVEGITHELYHVGSDEKMSLLLGVLQRDKPENALIFTNTKHMAVEVAKRLELNGYACEYIMGDLPQQQRLKVIEGVKSKQISFLVATDVAARGLHIDNLSMVVNYDLPADPESYVHRIGRTARAGKTGKAVSLACDRFVYGLEAIENYIKAKLPIMWPDSELFVEDKSAGKRLNIERSPRRDIGSRKGRPGSGRPAGKRSSGASSERRVASATAPARARTDSKNGKSLSEMSEQERLAYYRTKYGESFDSSSKEGAAPGPQTARPKKAGSAKPAAKDGAQTGTRAAQSSRRKKRPARRKSSDRPASRVLPPAEQIKPPISADYGVPRKSIFSKIVDLFKG
jgi:ATP-dependent RNA helicase RhlB